MLGDFSFYLGRTLLGLTLVSSALLAWRWRDRHRLDLGLFLLALAAAPVPPQGMPGAQAVKSALVCLLAYLAIRLVRHFKDVPPAILAVAIAMPVAVLIGDAAFGWQSSRGFRFSLAIYVGAAMTYAAAAMGLEVARSRGLRARRLTLAAAGTFLFGLSLGLAGLSSQGPAARTSAGPLQTFNNLGLLCYFFAFSPPRTLLARWRRLEQATYLDQVSEREPEERGWMAGDDLLSGALRCVGGAVTLVALRPDSDGELVVRASTEKELVGVAIASGDGLLADVVRSGVPRADLPALTGSALAPTLARRGINVLAAPITSGGRVWGVVAVVHRRGALFPEDDLSMLVQLGRHAAIALEHAALVLERRERAGRAAHRRLRELEARVDLMLASIADYAMLVVDATGHVAAWHTGAQVVFGHSREQIVGGSGAALFDLSAREFTAWLSDARQKGHAEREGSCRRADGRTFVGATIIRPLVDDAESPPGFVVVTRDITERRQLEDRLRQGQKMQAIGQLAGGVAHDFNNLLTAILGYADWLDHDLSGDPRRAQVTEIQRAAERAADLIRQLLAFSRRQNVRPVTVDLTRLVGDLLPMLRRLIGESIEIEDRSSPLASPVLADRSQLEQIVLNLVVNARDAMPDGGRITIRTADLWLDEDDTRSGLGSGAHVLLEVRDTGVGMDAETRRRAFEPFFTTKDVGQGTGLGLSTVYGIVQQMGGVVEVDSEIGRGTTFRIYLPLATESAADGARENPDAGSGRETVLLIEEDEALRAYLTQVLECDGYRVIAADHPTAALAMNEVFTEPIDLVIAGQSLAGTTGAEVVEQLSRRRPPLPALYLTAQAVPIEANRSSGGARHLAKPFSSTDLLTRVRQILLENQ